MKLRFTRKLRESKGSLLLTVPKEAKEIGFAAGDLVEVVMIKRDSQEQNEQDNN